MRKKVTFLWLGVLETTAQCVRDKMHLKLCKYLTFSLVSYFYNKWRHKKATYGRNTFDCRKMSKKNAGYFSWDFFVSSKLFQLIPGVNLKLDLVVMQSGYVKNSKAEVFSVFLIWEKSNQKMYWWNEIKIFEIKEIWHSNIWIVLQFSIFWKHWKKYHLYVC